MDEAAAETLHGRDGDELVVLLIRTAKALVERLRAQHPADSDSPMAVVHGLAAHYLVGRENVTNGDLARHLRITKQSASEVVAVLEAAGIVRRAPHPTDRRARVLILTDAGRTKLDEGRRRWHELEDEWGALVGRDRLEVVRDVLEAYLGADAAADDRGHDADVGPRSATPSEA